MSANFAIFPEPVTNDNYPSIHGIKKVDSIPRVWNDVLVLYNHWYPDARAWADLSSEKITLTVILGKHGGVCSPRHKLDESMPTRRQDARFCFWVPANSPVWLYCEQTRLVRGIQLKFGAEQLVSILGDELDCSRIHIPTSSIYDRRIAVCGDLLAELCVNPGSEDRIYGESIVTAMLSAALHAINREKKGYKDSGLLPWQLKITKEYLEENLTGDVSLIELSRLTGLSQSRLARGFKVSTGLPPYAWVLQERVRKAQQLLADSNISIASVARQIGFADQSHFTKVFRRTTGVTPNSWRTQDQRKSRHSSLE
jgi:AraC family transcriptional regulator